MENELNLSDFEEFAMEVKPTQEQLDDKDVATVGDSNVIDISDFEDFDPTADIKSSYEGKVESTTKSQIDTMYDTNSLAIDKAIEANPELKYVAESKKAENELKRKDAYDKAYKEQKAQERLEEAEVTGETEAVDIGSRVMANVDDVSMQFGQNILAPVLDKLGADDTAEEIRKEAQIASESLAKVNALYKNIYGEDAWDIAGGVTREVPNLAMAALTRGRTAPEAVGQAGIEYAKTGDVKTATLTGLIDGALGKVADVAFAKDAKKVFNKHIEELPDDQAVKVKEALETMYDMNIQKMDAKGRKQLLDGLDFTKTSQEITEEVKDRFDLMDIAESSKVDKAYDIANEIAEKSKPTEIKVSDIRQVLKDSDVLIDEDAEAVISKVKSSINAARKQAGTTDLNARWVESIVRKLKDNQRSASGSDVNTYKEIIGYFEGKSDELVGDLYKEARGMSKKYNTMFKGKIADEGVDIGKVVDDMLTKKKTYGESERLIGKDFDREKVNDLLKYKEITPEMRVDMAKDVLIGKIPLDELDTRDGVKSVLSRWNSADKSGMKMMLGKDYNKVAKQMGALEIIQNTMDTPNIKPSVVKSAGNFIMNALMIPVSPLFAYKGMVHEGKNITTSIAFKKTANEVRNSLKVFKDDGTIKSTKVYNSMIRALNVVVASTASEKLFGTDKTVDQYKGRKITMPED